MTLQDYDGSWRLGVKSTSLKAEAPKEEEEQEVALAFDSEGSTGFRPDEVVTLSDCEEVVAGVEDAQPPLVSVEGEEGEEGEEEAAGAEEAQPPLASAEGEEGEEEADGAEDVSEASKEWRWPSDGEEGEEEVVVDGAEGEEGEEEVKKEAKKEARKGANLAGREWAIKWLRDEKQRGFPTTVAACTVQVPTRAPQTPLVRSSGTGLAAGPRGPSGSPRTRSRSRSGVKTSPPSVRAAPHDECAPGLERQGSTDVYAGAPVISREEADRISGVRQELRKKKDWKAADELRRKLELSGWVVADVAGSYGQRLTRRRTPLPHPAALQVQSQQAAATLAAGRCDPVCLHPGPEVEWCQAEAGAELWLVPVYLLKFSHDSIGEFFRNGRSTHSLFEELIHGRTKPEEIPALTVARYPDHQGVHWLCIEGNRRLRALEKYQRFLENPQRRQACLPSDEQGSSQWSRPPSVGVEVVRVTCTVFGTRGQRLPDRLADKMRAALTSNRDLSKRAKIRTREQHRPTVEARPPVAARPPSMVPPPHLDISELHQPLAQ